MRLSKLFSFIVVALLVTVIFAGLITITTPAAAAAVATTTTVTASDIFPAIGQNITLSVTVKAGATVLTNKQVTVTHTYPRSTTPGTDGVFDTGSTGTTTFPSGTYGSAGQRVYTAAFAGDSTYGASSGTVTVNVGLPTTITVSTTTPTANQNFTITGRLVNGSTILTNQNVTLQRSTNNATWANVATKKTNETGWYTFSKNESAAGTYYYRTTTRNDTIGIMTSNVVTVTIGAWSNWESLSGQFTASPAAVSWADGRIDVFGRGSDSALWWRHYNNSAWSSWQSLSGQLANTTGPAVSSQHEGQLDVFAIGSDKALWHRSYVTTAGQSGDLDKWGIIKLQPTYTGREWYSVWDQGDYRTITTGDATADSVDTSGVGNSSQSLYQGAATYTIYGIDGDSNGNHKGEMFVQGMYPRIYCRPEGSPPSNGTAKWGNVEITLYGYTNSYNKNHSDWGWAGLEAVARTDHWNDNEDCGTAGYGARMLFSGMMDFEKEVSHGQGSYKDTQGESGTTNGVPHYEQYWSSGMPMKQWIGFKYVVRCLPDNSKCQMDLYVDLDEGANGGNWQHVIAFTDVSGWSAGMPTDCRSRDAGDVLAPNYAIYLRTDSIDASGNGQYYKWFSVREIAPLQQ